MEAMRIKKLKNDCSLKKNTTSGLFKPHCNEHGMMIRSTEYRNGGAMWSCIRPTCFTTCEEVTDYTRAFSKLTIETKAIKNKTARKSTTKKGTIDKLMKTFDKKCVYCDNDLVKYTGHAEKIKRKVATIDHFIPKNKGGPSGLYNLVLSCQYCNSVKGNNIGLNQEIFLTFLKTKNLILY